MHADGHAVAGVNVVADANDDAYAYANVSQGIGIRFLVLESLA